jgi:murein DD-endopeptidase MepM/ murein hydrolase activator NlpD
MSRLRALLVTAAVLLLIPLPTAAVEATPADTEPAVWPLAPRPEVVDPFSPPSSPWGPGHRGVDLAGVVGTPVRAPLPGRVLFAGRLAGRGVVSIGHGAFRTTYEPVSPTVSVGDEVTAGQRIGLLQSAGSHCFPRACLHWGLIVSGAYRDPLTLVGAGPVRLLPWRGLGPPVVAPWQAVSTGTLWLQGLLDRQGAVADSRGAVSPSPSSSR